MAGWACRRLGGGFFIRLASAVEWLASVAFLPLFVLIWYAVLIVECKRASEYDEAPTYDLPLLSVAGLRGLLVPDDWTNRSDVTLFSVWPTVKRVATSRPYALGGGAGAIVLLVVPAATSMMLPAEAATVWLDAAMDTGGLPPLDARSVLLWSGYVLAAPAVHFLALTVGLRLVAAGYRAAVDGGDGGRTAAPTGEAEQVPGSEASAD